MAMDLKPNTGILFENTNKEEEKQPDYTGELDFNGLTLRVAAWNRVGRKSGKPYISLTVKEE
ncbi:MAG: hypothetical protein PHN44_03635 [Candidatus Marinimicrobia bacterium]|jgi:uncharacterized protein (DUF736 family)|nr:hypothetical protein [Candidatus Neomarinimicrobiota bacterium]MDD5539308.1 hypothetical protein [Candidatus Neomarinimicrobiota bacterium]